MSTTVSNQRATATRTQNILLQHLFTQTEQWKMHSQTEFIPLPDFCTVGVDFVCAEVASVDIILLAGDKASSNDSSTFVAVFGSGRWLSVSADDPSVFWFNTVNTRASLQTPCDTNDYILGKVIYQIKLLIWLPINTAANLQKGLNYLKKFRRKCGGTKHGVRGAGRFIIYNEIYKFWLPVTLKTIWWTWWKYRQHIVLSNANMKLTRTLHSN